jgi:myo-inositol-1(or 4)-monophosphatase
VPGFDLKFDATYNRTRSKSPDNPSPAAEGHSRKVVLMDDNRLLETAVRAARDAGRLATLHLGNPGYQKWKGPHNIQVGAALDIQQRIVDIIRAEFPDHAFLLEESDEQPPLEAENLWIIDPIDGSLNFYQGVPFFSVCIGFREEGRYKLGVVYDPCRDELFQASRGHGATLNGKPINVDQVSEGMEAFQRAFVATDWPSDLARVKETLDIAALMAPQIVNLAFLGSPALALCYIGAGRLHGYYHLQLNLWDIAAAYVILVEGGGILTDAEGGSWLYSDGGYIASNNIIHGKLLHNVQSVLRMRQPPIG